MRSHLRRSVRSRVVDLFCGAGGLSEGFRREGFQIVAANDVDRGAGATYDLNHARHGTKFILGDITSRDVHEQLISAIGRKPVDVVTGGPPCQAFSQVRNHMRVIDDPRNRLYKEFVTIVGQLRPKVFVMENVPGLQNIAGGKIRQQILADLALDGEYKVESQVVEAADFGVPQMRQRVLFVGVRSDLGVDPMFPEGRSVTQLLRLARRELSEHVGSGSRWYYSLPAFERRQSAQMLLPFTSPSGLGRKFDTLVDVQCLLEELLDPGRESLVTVEQAIGDLEHLQPSQKLDRKPSNALVDYVLPPGSAYQCARREASCSLANADVPFVREDTARRLSVLPQGGNFRDLPDELCARYLNGKKWGPETGRDTLSRKYYFAYRKLHPHYFSWTLNTKADCVYHYSAPRALSVREFARLHSFDDGYHFMFGDRHSRYQQVGNAVPPLLASAIARAVAEILAASNERHDVTSALRVSSAV